MSQPLKFEMDPFAATGAEPHLGRPLQTAFKEIVRQIVLKTPVVLVTGGASTGKTLLVDMTIRTCAEMGYSVSRVDRGDLMHSTLGERLDVLLVDEANSVADYMLEAQAADETRGAATTVFLGLPSCAARFAAAGIRPAVIELTALPMPDARGYLLERAKSAGLPDLFTAEALDIIVGGADGSPRLLRSIASLAFFRAACEGASQIGVRYAASALVAQQIPSDGGDAPSESVDEPSLADLFAQESLKQPVLPMENAPLPVQSVSADAPVQDSPPVRPVPLVILKQAEQVKHESPAPIPNDAFGAEVIRLDTVRVNSPSEVQTSRKPIWAAASIVIAAAAVIAVFAAVPSLKSLYAAYIPNVISTPGQSANGPNVSQVAQPISVSADSSASAPPVPAAPSPVQTQVVAEAKPPANATDADGAPAKTAPRRPLSDDEQAAVARGVRALDLPSTALKSSLNPH